MTIPSVRSLAPMRINTTVVPVSDLQVPPEVASEVFRHSGNEFGSALVVPGAAPRARWRMPFKTAYDLIGLKMLKATVHDIYFAKFVDGIRDSLSTHAKIPLNTSAQSWIFIRSVSVRDREIAWANCEAIFASSDGMTHPFGTLTNNNALPTLASQPSLHTMGPSNINGTVTGGSKEFTWEFNPRIDVGIDGSPGDGLLYPMVVSYLGGEPLFEVGHGDPVTLLGSLGYTGTAVNASTFVQWLRDYDSTNHVALSTGVSLTVANGGGRMIPVDFGADSGRLTRGGFRLEPLSLTTTYPVAVSTGSVPSL